MGLRDFRVITVVISVACEDCGFIQGNENIFVIKGGNRIAWNGRRLADKPGIDYSSGCSDLECFGAGDA